MQALGGHVEDLEHRNHRRRVQTTVIARIQRRDLMPPGEMVS